MNRKILIILTLTFLSVLCNKSLNAQVNANVVTNNWNAAASWVLGVIPQTDDDVFIPAGAIITININSDIINNITVNGTLIIQNAASASLSIKGNITVGPNGTVTNNGRFDMVAPGNFTLGFNATYTHNPRANTLSDESPFENGTEFFDPTSNLIITKWSSTNVPLFDPFRIGNRDIGNLIINYNGGSAWEQNGLFSNHVKGTLTTNAGTLRMDDGTTNSTSLTLNDVNVIGSSNIIFQEGSNRPLTLTTGNFTFSSTTPDTMFVMNGKNGASIGNFVWNVTGNVVINNHFMAVYNVDSIVRNANATINVTGNFTISKNIRFDILKQVNGSCNINIGGDFTIAGPVFPAYVRFIDSNSGNLTFSANNVFIQGGAGNTFMGGNAATTAWINPKGLVNFNVNQDFIISGNSTTYIVNSPAHYFPSLPPPSISLAKVNKTRVTVGRDFIISAALADFKVANDSGAVTFLVGRNLSMSGGFFDAQLNPGSVFIDSVVVSNDFTFSSASAANYFKANGGAGATVLRVLGNFTLTNSGVLSGQGVYGNYGGNGNVEFYTGGTFTQTNGLFAGIFSNSPSTGNGNLNYTIANAFVQNGGYHYGINNTTSPNAGTPIFNYNSIQFNNGYYEAFKGGNISYAINNYTVTNNLAINFAAASNSFQVNSVALVASNSNTMGLNMNVGGNLTIAGALGTFISNKGFGNENINITGNFTVTGGNNSFNFLPGNTTIHNVTMTIGGNLSISAGTTYLSGDEGDFTGAINGDLIISAGTLNMKGTPPTSLAASLNINGGMNVSGGAFYFYNNLSRANNVHESVVRVNYNDDPIGDFIQTGGIINMGNNPNSTKWDTLIIKSPVYTLGSTGQLIQGNTVTSSFNGILKFDRTGTTIYSRSIGSSHNIQQVKQIVGSNTTLDVITGDIQICSHNTPNIDHFAILTNATVILRNNSKIFSNATAPNAGIYVGANGRLKLQNINGLYDATANAAFSSVGNLDYYLFPTSIIEYNGDDNQKLTGIGYGIATLSKHKYGILEINFQGTDGGEWVYPISAGVVAIRGQLILRKGELNLSNNSVGPRNAAAGGIPIIIENPMDTALKYLGMNNGYIRAETYDGLSTVKWKISTNVLLHTVPFKRDWNEPAGANWMTLGYQANAGATAGDTVSFTTFRTNAANTPYPPGVSHVDNTSGVDNSLNTIDRFWLVRKTGVPITASIYLKALPNDMASVTPVPASYRGQNFLTPSQGWNFPIPGVQAWNAGTGTLTVTGAPVASISGWWALASVANPLPVELLDFNATCSGKNVSIKWTTASELNNNFFEVHKSFNGNSYSLLKRISGTGTTNELSHYEVIDQNNYSKVFYRLMQSDFNGEPTELKTISINACSDNNFELISALQQNSEIKLVASVPIGGEYLINVMDNAGRLVARKSFNLQNGVNEITIPGKFAVGLYLININNGVNNKSAKVFIR
jgi:G8 domain